MPLTQPSKLELNTIRELIDFDDLRVLEVGAGDGRLTFPFAGQAACWVALDQDEDEVRLAAAELRTQPLPMVRLALGDARQLSFESNYFDIVFFTWSLCCIPHLGMASAVREAHRVLRSGGLLLDIHPTDEASTLEVWYATAKDSARQVSAENLEAVTRVPLGPLEHDAATRLDFTKATEALVEPLDVLFDLAAVKTFEYQYFFDSLDELTDYLQDNHEHARASDDLLERATIALSRAPTPPKLVIVQRTVVAALRKL